MHVAGRRDGGLKGVCGDAVGGVPEVVADGETGFLVPASRSRGPRRGHHRAAEGQRCNERAWEKPALTRARKLFTVEHMVDGTTAVYERLLGVKGR